MVLVKHSLTWEMETRLGKVSRPMSIFLVSLNLLSTISQTSTIFRPSRVQNLVLYWPQYKAQLMLQSPTEANTCAEPFGT